MWSMGLHSEPLWFKFIKSRINKMFSVYYCRVLLCFGSSVSSLSLNSTAKAHEHDRLQHSRHDYKVYVTTERLLFFTCLVLVHSSCETPAQHLLWRRVTVGQWVTNRVVCAGPLVGHTWSQDAKRNYHLCINRCFDLANADVTNAANGCTTSQTELLLWTLLAPPVLFLLTHQRAGWLCY